MKKIIVFLAVIGVLTANVFSQEAVVDYANPKQYTIADINVSGIKFLSKDALILLSGLSVGQKIMIPGDEIASAIQRLWDQDLFSDVKISIDRIEGDSVYLDIYLQEMPRLNETYFTGINQTMQSDLKEKLDLRKGKKVTKTFLHNSEIIIKRFLAEKGYPFADVKFRIVDDTALLNVVNLYIDIDKKNKVKIQDIIIKGNNAFSDRKIRRILKETKRKNFFRFWKPSKFQKEKYEEDKKRLIEKYNQAGYRDAKIVEDSVYVINDKRISVFIHVDEGPRYYFRNITWVGNTKYSSDLLTAVLDIKKGDPYNQKRLQDRLINDEDAVGSLYFDNGYLFFHAVPKEVNIVNDSIDVEIMIFEGPQAKINRVIIEGNTRTNDHVIRRELRTLPGDLFSKTNLVRSVRELANLGNFDPEQLAPQPIPDQQNGTVDIKYKVVERPSDLFEMSGGWGMMNFVMQFAVKFNNFSIRNIGNFKYWDPLPMGDGQKLSFSTYIGGTYKLINFSFVEPWLGGKKPNTLSVNVYYNLLTNGVTPKQAEKYNLTRNTLNLYGASIGMGRRLQWPDDYFILNTSLTYELYHIKGLRTYIDIDNGYYNLLSGQVGLTRNSIDNPLYTRKGSNITFQVQATPPYSLFIHKPWSSLSDSLRFRLVEFYKFTIKGAWYNQIVKNLVISARFEYGLMGYYNRQIGYSPFGEYVVGGDGMGFYATFGKEYIGLRGYKNYSISQAVKNGTHLYEKYTLELRYPVLLKEMATFYVLSFLEAGNAWYHINEFDPFKFYRSVGVGARLFVPMLGLVGIDFGYGLDEVPNAPDANGWNVHFVFGQRF